jgi:hypothetical protein
MLLTISQLLDRPLSIISKGPTHENKIYEGEPA